ncbi:MAG: diguanylate cyclase [Alphaproteobacteria bacterium]|nr:diguanylate cyclase [Alphaproteobacteria bacterium]
MLLPRGLGRDAVRLLCDGIVESICAEIEIEGGHASVGASIGVAWWPEDARTAKSVIRSADEALYRSQRKTGAPILPTTREPATRPESRGPGAPGPERRDPDERIAARVAPQTPR